MKLKVCPKCGSKNLGDRWTNGRKLEQYCNGKSEWEDEVCLWVGEPRTPEKIRITNTKDLRIDNFYGWDYIELKQVHQPVLIEYVREAGDPLD